MKKYCLFLIILITISCEKPNQFTSVEGYVTDYYSKEPVAGVSLEISEIKPFNIYHDYLLTDTVVSNADGFYYSEFYNKEYRYYGIKSLATENYYSCNSCFSKTIPEGKTNTINFAVKPYKTLTLNCYNKSNTYNWLHISSDLYEESFFCYPCAGLTVYNIKVVHEENNHLSIQVSHYENNKRDTTKIEDIKFYSAKNDTTIYYYY